MTEWTPKSEKPTPFSEEEVCIVSKAGPCLIWTGTKILYSGDIAKNSGGASGYNFWSGETDIEPINNSGWGNIRVPELNQLHKIFVFPKNPKLIARADYTTLTIGTTSGLPDGHGGCSGKMALIHYEAFCSGCMNASGTDYMMWTSGKFNSGLVDILAFGSEY